MKYAIFKSVVNVEKGNSTTEVQSYGILLTLTSYVGRGHLALLSPI